MVLHQSAHRYGNGIGLKHDVQGVAPIVGGKHAIRVPARPTFSPPPQRCIQSFRRQLARETTVLVATPPAETSRSSRVCISKPYLPTRLAHPRPATHPPAQTTRYPPAKTLNGIAEWVGWARRDRLHPQYPHPTSSACYPSPGCHVFFRTRLLEFLAAGI